MGEKRMEDVELSAHRAAAMMHARRPETLDLIFEELDRARESERELAKQLKECADFIEECFRGTFVGANKAELNRQVKEHALLKPARAALKKAGVE